MAGTGGGQEGVPGCGAPFVRDAFPSAVDEFGGGGVEGEGHAAAVLGCRGGFGLGIGRGLDDLGHLAPFLVALDFASFEVLGEGGVGGRFFVLGDVCETGREGEHVAGFINAAAVFVVGEAVRGCAQFAGGIAADGSVGGLGGMRAKVAVC